MGMDEALNAGAVFADINVRMEGFEKDMATVMETLNRVDKRLNETAKNKNLTKVAEGMAKAGQKATLFFSLPLAALAGLSVKASSDLNETISKTQQIFGQATDDMLKWAKTADTTLGMSQRVALDSAASFALFGKSAGLAGQQVNDFSKQNVALAADMASFFNTSPEDAITAIGAALRGETEPIRRYNVLLDDMSMRQEAVKQGIISTTKQALTPQQRILAAHALIMKQTSAAQGDFARTSDGLANEQRIVKAQVENTMATLGNQMLPIVLTVTTHISELVAWISTWDESTIKLAIALGVAVAAAGPLMTVVGKGISTFQSISSVVGAVTAAMNGKTIADGSNAAAVAAHTIVTKLNSGAIATQEAVTKKATIATKAFNVAMKATVAGLVIAAGIKAATSIYEYTAGIIEAAKNQREFNKLLNMTGEELDKLSTKQKESAIELLEKQIEENRKTATTIEEGIESYRKFANMTKTYVPPDELAGWTKYEEAMNKVFSAESRLNALKKEGIFSDEYKRKQQEKNLKQETATGNVQTDNHNKWLDYIKTEIELEKQRYDNELKDMNATKLTDEQRTKAKLKLAQEHAQKISEIENRTAKERTSLWKSSFELNTDAASKFESIYEAQMKGTISATQAAAMKIVSYMTSALAGVNDAMNSYFSAQSQMIDDRYDHETSAGLAYQAYQDQQDRIAYNKLSAKGKKEYNLRKAAEKAQEELDEKRDKAQRKLAYKQALWQRAMALFQIPVNTSMAIMQIWSNPANSSPYEAAKIALTALAAATGAAQLAATFAAPLPKMWTGGVVKAKPGVGTDVTVGERGYDEYIVPDTDYVINRLAQKIKGVTSQKDSSSQSGSSESKANSTGEGFLSIVASDVKIGMDKVGEVLFKVTKSGQGLVAKEAVV